MPDFEQLSPADFILLASTILVLILTAISLYLKTRTLHFRNFKNWNPPRKYEAVLLILILILNVVGFLTLTQCGKHDFDDYCFVVRIIYCIVFNGIFIIIAYAILYRYRKLFPCLRSSTTHKVIQGIKVSLILVATFLFCTLCAAKLLPEHEGILTLIWEYVTLVFYVFMGVLDLYANIKMALHILSSSVAIANQKRKNKASVNILKRKLIGLLLVTIFLDILSAIDFFTIYRFPNIVISFHMLITLSILHIIKNGIDSVGKQKRLKQKPVTVLSDVACDSKEIRSNVESSPTSDAGNFK